MSLARTKIVRMNLDLNFAYMVTDLGLQGFNSSFSQAAQTFCLTQLADQLELMGFEQSTDCNFLCIPVLCIIRRAISQRNCLTQEREACTKLGPLLLLQLQLSSQLCPIPFVQTKHLLSIDVMNYRMHFNPERNSQLLLWNNTIQLNLASGDWPYWLTASP